MGGAGEEKIEGPSAGPSAHGTERVQASEWKCGCRPLPPEREADLPDQVGHAVGFGLLRAALSARSRWCQTTDQG